MVWNLACMIKENKSLGLSASSFYLWINHTLC